MFLRPEKPPPHCKRHIEWCKRKDSRMRCDRTESPSVWFPLVQVCNCILKFVSLFSHEK
uniref:Uncharacterized protein n=1 Tax=Rhizophora mucronata TaxID=61149 RepID=A0A2P2NLA9_RHIMU